MTGRNRSRSVAIFIAIILAGCSGNPQKQWTAPPCALPDPSRLVVPFERCGPYDVADETIVLGDATRNRKIEATVYAPARGTGPFPLILFSHGLGNSHEGYRYLGRHWASHGYIAVHLNHQGSDLAVLNEDGVLSLMMSLVDRKHWRDRAKDVSFAITELGARRASIQVASLGKETLAPSTLLEGRIDFTRIGVAGHSFGAFTALEIIGLRVGTKAPDPRVRAAIIISAPRLKRLAEDDDFAKIATPALHLTGTRDESRLFYTFLRHRRMPFDKMGRSDQYLVILKGADHSTFSDDPPEFDPNHARHIHAIQTATTAFWDAYLKGEPGAKEWLRSGRISEWLGESASVEFK